MIRTRQLNMIPRHVPIVRSVAVKMGLMLIGSGGGVEVFWPEGVEIPGNFRIFALINIFCQPECRYPQGDGDMTARSKD